MRMFDSYYSHSLRVLTTTSDSSTGYSSAPSARSISIPSSGSQKSHGSQQWPPSWPPEDEKVKIFNASQLPPRTRHLGFVPKLVEKYEENDENEPTDANFESPVYKKKYSISSDKPKVQFSPRVEEHLFDKNDDPRIHVKIPKTPKIIIESATPSGYWSDVPLPEEKIRLSDGIVRLQSGTNKYASQKQMMSFGTNRRETTKMIDTKHPEYDHEKPDQAEIPLQSGTNKFASQKGMMSFGTNRRETTKMLDTNHPDYDHTQSIDQTQIPYQMGSNQYASQKGMTSFGQPRWEVLDPSISWQNRKSQGMVRLQSGTNRFASQAGWWGSSGFGTPRNNTYEAEGGELPYEDMKKSESIIPSQAGWNKGDSQKLMTSFGSPRDVRGKHLKRLWELEYPEEAEIPLDRL